MAEQAIALDQRHEASWRWRCKPSTHSECESITRRYDDLTHALDEELGLQPTRESQCSKPCSSRGSASRTDRGSASPAATGPILLEEGMFAYDQPFVIRMLGGIGGKPRFSFTY
jgi:hypothetical protein